MVDTRIIDARAFYEQYVKVVGRPTTSRGDGKEYHGSCPWCGGTDRFAFWDSGRYSCSIRASGCGRSGRDVIDFLREYEGLTFFEVCDELDLDPGSAYARPATLPSSPEGEPPSKTWQEQAAAVVHQAQKILWSNRGCGALQYLRGRGFTDETIREAHLGYIPLTREGRWFRDAPASWGLSSGADLDACVWLPEGILIPWLAGGQLWKLNVRRTSGLKEGDAKYVQITGSGEGLYNVDAIRSGAPLVLCESEFDALSGQQVCADLAAFVATGATTRARRACWVEHMKQALVALVAYDDDPVDKNGTRAGDRGAVYWVQALPEAIRWMPWAHDVSEMLQQGQNLRQWVDCGRAVAASKDVPMPLALMDGRQEGTIPGADELDPVPPSCMERPCIRCGGHDMRKREDGVWLCTCYWTWEKQSAQKPFLQRMVSKAGANSTTTRRGW